MLSERDDQPAHEGVVLLQGFVAQPRAMAPSAHLPDTRNGES